MAAKPRLDAELVRRGLARSRQQAQELVAAGRVRVGGLVITKPASGVDLAASVQVLPAGGDDYVSRGAHKLAGALDALGGPEVAERRWLDAGASTGGFTDVLLRRGARQVVAVDVGYGQLSWRLRTDERVQLLERTNVRNLDAASIGGPADATTADLSFISLTTVLPALTACTVPDGDLVLLVKPQFEAGRAAVDTGVVRDRATRADAVRRVAAAAADLGWGAAGVCASPLAGPAGNRELFLWLRRDAAGLAEDALAEAVESAP
jgi:23S rRNA (cytidine1920-2'-O)/16S rRNA (cytidine1409-2'-O)-methyltransferase